MKSTAQKTRSEIVIRLNGVEVRATGATREEAVRAILAACEQANQGENK